MGASTILRYKGSGTVSTPPEKPTVRSLQESYPLDGVSKSDGTSCRVTHRTPSRSNLSDRIRPTCSYKPPIEARKKLNHLARKNVRWHATNPKLKLLESRYLFCQIRTQHMTNGISCARTYGHARTLSPFYLLVLDGQLVPERLLETLFGPLREAAEYRSGSCTTLHISRLPAASQ